MPKLKNVFLQFIAAVNNNPNYKIKSRNNSSIATRIEDVLFMAPAHILQKLNKATFDKEMERPKHNKNIENEITVSIFKAFLRFSEEEQMTIQKFLHCSCFDKIVKYMTPEQKVETCKHIEKYIETIQNSINATIESRNPTQQETKPTTKAQKTKQQTTLPTEETPENTKEAPENTRNVQGLIQELKKYTVTTTPTEDSTKTISTTIKQLQQKTTTFQVHEAENVFINTLYEALDIRKLDKIGVPIKTTNTLLRKKQDTKNTQAKQPRTTPAKKIKIAQATEKIQETAKKTKEEKRRERGNEIKRMRRKRKKDEALKKYEEEAIIETKEEKEAREAAETKARYQIISLIHDTPHKKELKEQYIKDNPQITKHELYPILEAIHNYIYEESETEQENEQSTTEQENETKQEREQSTTEQENETEKESEQSTTEQENETKQESEQSTTEQEKKQISALAMVHNTIPVGHNQCLEFYKQVNRLQTCAQNTPAHATHHLCRILHNTRPHALKNLFGSTSIHQVVNSHLIKGNNPNKLSAFLQGIFDLDQKIRDTENTGNTTNYRPTPLETSSLSLIGLYIYHCSDQTKLEFLQKAKISDPKTEEEAKKSITDALKEIKKETETVPFKLIQQVIKTRFRKIISNNKKNTIQDIFAYIKEAESCDKITLYKTLSLKHLITQHEHNQPKELYKYHKEFINNTENIQAIEKTIQTLFANFIFLELLRSPEQKNEDSKNTSKNAHYYLNPYKISATQQIIKKIILSLMQAKGISYMNIIESFNLTLEQHAQLIKEYTGPDPLTQITKFIFQQTYGSETPVQLRIKTYEPIMQQIVQEQKTYFTDNETAISEEQSATIETKTRTKNIKHSRAPINLQATTTHTPSSKQEQPQVQQLVATTQKTNTQTIHTARTKKIHRKKRKDTNLLNREYKTTHKTQQESTSPQKPPTPTTITETPYAQKTQQKKRKREYLLNTEHETPHKKQYENTSPQNPPTLITEITNAQQNKAAHSQR